MTSSVLFRTARQLPQGRASKGHNSTARFQTPKPSRKRRVVADSVSDDEAPVKKRRRTREPVKAPQAPVTAPSSTHADPEVIPQDSKNEPQMNDDDLATKHVGLVDPDRGSTRTLSAELPEQSAWELEIAQQCAADAKRRAIYMAAIEQVTAICRIPFGSEGSQQSELQTKLATSTAPVKAEASLDVPVTTELAVNSTSLPAAEASHDSTASVCIDGTKLQNDEPATANIGSPEYSLSKKVFSPVRSRKASAILRSFRLQTLHKEFASHLPSSPRRGRSAAYRTQGLQVGTN